MLCFNQIEVNVTADIFLPQTLITDMAAHSYVIDDINKLADDMIQAGHNKTDYVKKRRAEINDR